MLAVFEEIVDYAGLFPPASLGMAEAVRAYDGYRRSPDRGMLARFVVAAGRLEEAGAALESLPTAVDAHDPWQLSVVVGAAFPSELNRIAAFRERWDRRGVLIDTVEARAPSVEQVIAIGEMIPASYRRFFEVPATGPYDELVQAIARIGAFAKIRTGGTTPELFPSPEALTQFLVAVTTHHVPFKATAGLHHAFRGSYPLTYQPGAEHWVMCGFVNVLLATAELLRGGSGETARMILEENEATAFERSAEAIAWRGQRYASDELASARRQAFLGFGSCSFREPVDELRLSAVA